MEKVNVELFMPGELKNEPVICTLIKEFDINLKIVEASFSTESGWAYVILEAEKPEIEKVFEYLREKGINTEVRES